jgi:hypothetical protein
MGCGERLISGWLEVAGLALLLAYQQLEEDEGGQKGKRGKDSVRQYSVRSLQSCRCACIPSAC